MNLRRILLIPVVSLLGVIATPITSASAVDIPAEALDFIINVTPPTATEMKPDCGDPTSLFQSAIMSGQTTVNLTCSINNNAQVLSGTASNTRLTATDPGFNNGTIAATCQAQQQFTSGMTISGTFPNITVGMSSLSGSVLQVCSFTLAFQDAEKSTLAGTIELNGTVGTDKSTFETNKTIALSFTAKVFITNGTGAFKGYVGSGTFVQSQTIDLNEQFKNTPTSGGGSSTQPGTSDYTAFCTANSISPCELQKIAEECITRQLANCPINVTQQTARVSTASVRKAATASKMTLTLKKGAGQVRISAPTPAVGKKKATVKSNTKITLTATPKAVCKVVTNTGKTVGTAKANNKGKATIRPAANAYNGAESVRAACTLNKKSFKSAALQISMK